MSAPSTSVTSMTLRRACVLVPFFALFLPGGICAMAAPPPSAEALSRVLNDPALWGKDFPAALAALPSWRKAGETKVSVFPEKMAGEKRYRRSEEAGGAAERLRQAIAAAPPSPRSGLPGGLTQTLIGAREQLAGFRIEAPAFLEDDSFRVTWSSPSVELLQPGLTVAKVRERLGPAQAVRQVVLQTEGERRPVILTVYVYLGGAVVFAESDMAPRPGLVDRVLLDIPAMTAVLFAGAR